MNENNKPKMDERVRKLMNTICDLKALERDARKLDYDFRRIPLGFIFAFYNKLKQILSVGKITKEQIQAGYEALTRIEQHIQEQKFDNNFREAVNAYAFVHF